MESRLIRDFYTSNPISIGISASVKEAIDSILLNDIRHLPVVDEKNIVVGMISESDILPFLKDFEADPKKLSYMEIKSIMAKDVQVISVDDSLDIAAQMMIEGYFHSLPVVDNQKLLGIITSTDLLRFIIDGEDVMVSREQNLFQTNGQDISLQES